MKPSVICLRVKRALQTNVDLTLSRVNDMLQSLVSGSSTPDGDGGDEDRVINGGVEVHHHWLWQVVLLQLPQEVHPLLFLLGEGADVKVTVVPRKWKDSSVSAGESHRGMGADGAGFF